jgi:hypothetical protein
MEQDTGNRSYWRFWLCQGCGRVDEAPFACGCASERPVVELPPVVNDEVLEAVEGIEREHDTFEHAVEAQEDFTFAVTSQTLLELLDPTDGQAKLTGSGRDVVERLLSYLSVGTTVTISEPSSDKSNGRRRRRAARVDGADDDP